MSATFRDWGRLLRLSLAPSAAADVASGLVLGHHGRWPAGAAPFLLIASSLCVYHGALALNDWADREHDAATRPDRPIPAGRIEAGDALSVGAGLLFAALALAMLVRHEMAVWMGILAWLAWMYDTKGRGPWMGPLLLALCRGGNLAVGMAAAELDPVHAHDGFAIPWLLAVLYGVYVFLVSRLGRMEDAEDSQPLRQRPRRLLLALAFCLLLIPCVPVPPNVTELRFAGRAASFVLVAVSAVGLARFALAQREWTRGLVMAGMGRSLRRLLVFSAACCLLAGTSTAFVVAGVILVGGYGASYALRGVFPPT